MLREESFEKIAEVVRQAGGCVLTRNKKTRPLLFTLPDGCRVGPENFTPSLSQIQT
jgi:hypothetical protein